MTSALFGDPMFYWYTLGAFGIIVSLITLLTFIFIWRMSRSVSRLKLSKTSQDQSGVLPMLVTNQNTKFESLERTLQNDLLQNKTIRTQLADRLNNISEILGGIQASSKNLSNSQNKLYEEFMARPKPSPYIRFPAEFAAAYDDTKKRILAFKAKAKGINDNYDVKIFETIIKFIDEEVKDIDKSDAQIDNLAGRVTVINRTITTMEKIMDEPETLRRMKKLKEDGFSARLEI